MRTSFKTLIVLLIVLGLGILIGQFVRSIPLLTFQKEFSLGEIADFIMALVLAIVIPLILNKSMDDERHIKDFIVEELKDCIAELKKIKDKIDRCGLKGTTTELERKEINLKIQNHGIKVDALKNQLAISFKKKSGAMQKDIILEYLEYWKAATGSNLMNENFNINPEFCKQHDTAYCKFYVYLKQCVHLVNQF